jgi:S-adenosylmethionine:tRNA-ribosyltransferase-isomerase (queuine synthetase)
MMQVTLKKAAALAAALSGVAIAASPSLNLSAYSSKNISEEVEYETGVLKASVEKALQIAEAGYSIRALIGIANEGEINNLLTTRAAIDKKLSIINAVHNQAKAPDYDALTAQREVMKTGEQSVYSQKTLSVTIPTADFTTPLLKTLKKERIKIEDKLAQLNFTKTIQLPEEVVSLLTELDLI